MVELKQPRSSWRLCRMTLEDDTLAPCSKATMLMAKAQESCLARPSLSLDFFGWNASTSDIFLLPMTLRTVGSSRPAHW